jgi:putative tricarboxylic transport membrane protein
MEDKIEQSPPGEIKQSLPGKTEENPPGEKILIWFLLLFGIFISVAAYHLPLEKLSSSGAFPLFIGGVMIATAGGLLWKNRRRYSEYKLGEQIKEALPLVLPARVVIYSLIVICYIFLMRPLGFWVSSPLFLIGSFLYLRGAGIIRSVIITALFLVTCYFLFQYLFKVMFE